MGLEPDRYVNLREMRVVGAARQTKRRVKVNITLERENTSERKQKWTDNILLGQFLRQIEDLAGKRGGSLLRDGVY